MTFLEKYIQNHPESGYSDFIMPNYCPDAYGYEKNSCETVKCSYKSVSCKECWEREMPEEDLCLSCAHFKTGEYGKICTRMDGIFSKKIVKCINFKLYTDEIIKDGTPESRIPNALREAVDMPVIKDSGARREFETGAVRDIQEGKGRCDLLPLDVVSGLTNNHVLRNISMFKHNGDTLRLEMALKEFVTYYTTWCGDSTFAKNGLPNMCLEVSKHFEEGVKKYGEYNWQKGIPTHCYIDSAVRHYLKYLRGDKDEPHDRAFVWNILCCIWTCIHKPELNDYTKKEV